MSKEKQYLFVSDIRGNDENLEKELKQIVADVSPSIVFFLDDIVVTQAMDQLKNLFYQVHKPMRELFKNNPYPKDQEILSYPIENNRTLVCACAELWEHLHHLYPKYKSFNAVTFAKTIASHIDFRHYFSDLPDEIQEIVKKDTEVNAHKIIDLMSELAKESLVVILEGKTNYHFKRYFDISNPNVTYLDEAGIIETEDSIFVLCPYDNALYAAPIPIPNQDNRKIILAAYGVLDCKSIKDDTPTSPENSNIELNIKNIFNDLKPDAVVHAYIQDQGNDYVYNNTPVYYLPAQTVRLINF